MALQHLRASTANKRPTPGSMSDGQLAMNTNLASPGLFFKDSNGDLVKVGPVHVGSTAPNVSPAVGGQSGNSKGEQWLDTSGTNPVLKVWDGSAWQSEAGEFVNASGDVMTGALGIIAGTAAAPGLYVSGDTNTGIYSPGADQVAISTNGTGRLFVDASGNVGINSAGDTGGSKFYIVGNATAGLTNIATIRTGIGNSYGLQIKGNYTTEDYLIQNYYPGALAFGTNNTERMRLDSSGRLGLGTSSPSTYGAQLAVIGGSVHADRGIGGAAAQVQFSMGASSGANFGQIGNTGTRWSLGYGATANTIGTEVLVWNSSGNVGIGTTSPGEKLDISSGTSGTAAVVKIQDPAGRVVQIASPSSSTEAYIGTTTSHRLDFYTNNTVKATLDTSGRLLVGTSTSSSNASIVLQGNSGGATGGAVALLQCGTSAASIGATATDIGYIWFADNAGGRFAEIKAQSDGTAANNDYPGRLVFSTTADGASSPTERMRIQNDGVTRFTTDGSYTGVDTNSHAVRTAITGTWVIDTFHAGASANGIHVEYGTTPNGANNHFFYADDATAKRFTVRSNGGIENYQANDANLCDEREKKNIETLESTWNCLKDWEIKKFHYNEDAETDSKRYGVIAQQVAEHCPEVITDWVKQKAKDAELDEDGNIVTPAKEEIVRMGVKEQQMYWMAIKALQEAQVRIEALEAEVAALKGA